MKSKDRIGQKYGRLLVISVDQKSKTVFCICDCGSEGTFRLSHISNGSSRSCGCLRRDLLVESKTIHGWNGTPEYRAWQNLKSRATNENMPQRKDYIGRGISVSDDWIDSFEAFLRDVGPRPSPNHTIERKNNNLGYSGENCEWATRKAQNNNKRNNRLLRFNGRSMTMAMWADEIGCSQSCLLGRINRGWSVEDALTKSVRPMKRRSLP